MKTAWVLPTTITGSEGHDPVLARIPFFRTVKKKKPTVYKRVWNLNRLRNNIVSRTRFRELRNKILSSNYSIHTTVDEL